MNDIIYVQNTAYARYEELLLQRDQLKKEAFQWEQEYIREFGEMILEIFELKISCIRKKKMIGYCQTIANHGGVIDPEKLNKYLEQEMEQYFS